MMTWKDAIAIINRMLKHNVAEIIYEKTISIADIKEEFEERNINIPMIGYKDKKEMLYDYFAIAKWIVTIGGYIYEAKKKSKEYIARQNNMISQRNTNINNTIQNMYNMLRQGQYTTENVIQWMKHIQQQINTLHWELQKQNYIMLEDIQKKQDIAIQYAQKIQEAMQNVNTTKYIAYTNRNIALISLNPDNKIAYNFDIACIMRDYIKVTTMHTDDTAKQIAQIVQNIIIDAWSEVVGVYIKPKSEDESKLIRILKGDKRLIVDWKRIIVRKKKKNGLTIYKQWIHVLFKKIQEDVSK